MKGDRKNYIYGKAKNMSTDSQFKARVHKVTNEIQEHCGNGKYKTLHSMYLASFKPNKK